MARGGERPRGRLWRRGGALAAALLLPACAGTLTSDQPAQDIATVARPAGVLGKGEDPSAGESKKAAAFNPFATPGSEAPGGREIIQNPSLAEVMKVGSLEDRAYGRADAPVTLIKYASLTCPYCRKFQAEVFPTFKKEYIDTGKVRFILREFPIGHTSGTATIVWRCAPADKHLALYDRFLQQQGSWVSQEVRLDPIFAVARQVGMSRAEFDACLKNQAMIAGLKWVKERGRTLGVIGTPNFFVNQRLVKRVLDLSDLRQLVEAELAGKVAGRK